MYDSAQTGPIDQTNNGRDDLLLTAENQEKGYEQPATFERCNKGWGILRVGVVADRSARRDFGRVRCLGFTAIRNAHLAIERGDPGIAESTCRRNTPFCAGSRSSQTDADAGAGANEPLRITDA